MNTEESQQNHTDSFEAFNNETLTRIHAKLIGQKMTKQSTISRHAIQHQPSKLDIKKFAQNDDLIIESSAVSISQLPLDATPPRTERKRIDVEAIVEEAGKSKDSIRCGDENIERQLFFTNFPVVHKGKVWKRSKYPLKNWRPLYLEARSQHEVSGLLLLYENENDSNPWRCIDLDGCTSVDSLHDATDDSVVTKFPFKLLLGKKDVTFATATLSESEEWVHTITSLLCSVSSHHLHQIQARKNQSEQEVKFLIDENSRLKNEIESLKEIISRQNEEAKIKDKSHEESTVRALNTETILRSQLADMKSTIDRLSVWQQEALEIQKHFADSKDSYSKSMELENLNADKIITEIQSNQRILESNIVSLSHQMSATSELLCKELTKNITDIINDNQSKGEKINAQVVDNVNESVRNSVQIIYEKFVQTQTAQLQAIDVSLEHLLSTMLNAMKQTMDELQYFVKESLLNPPGTSEVVAAIDKLILKHHEQDLLLSSIIQSSPQIVNVECEAEGMISKLNHEMVELGNQKQNLQKEIIYLEKEKENLKYFIDCLSQQSIDRIEKKEIRAIDRLENLLQKQERIYEEQKLQLDVERESFKKQGTQLKSITTQELTDLNVSNASMTPQVSEQSLQEKRTAPQSEAIRVAIRARPLNEQEKTKKSPSIINFNDPTSCTIRSTKEKSITGPDNMKKEFTFTYDHAYSEQVSQEQIYQDMGRPILNKALEGYNGTIFCYGQTGSGKTFSMTGIKSDPGLIYKLSKDLFLAVGAAVNEKYRVTVSYLEIYNEQILDLLLPSGRYLEIREHPTHGVYVENLLEIVVHSYEDIQRFINQGQESRTIGETNMNSESSRSHSIFTITIQKYSKENNAAHEVAVTSKIRLVDLAGSERANATGAVGERLKEGASINKSLSCLGNVINALADPKRNRGHIPYRDSKLTRILQESLGGNSLTVMLATVSPAEMNFEETLSTLTYANRAKNITNKAVVNEDKNSRLIRLLREENEYLRRLLKKHGIPIGDIPGRKRFGFSTIFALLTCKGEDPVDASELEQRKPVLKTAQIPAKTGTRVTHTPQSIATSQSVPQTPKPIPVRKTHNASTPAFSGKNPLPASTESLKKKPTNKVFPS